MHGLVGNCTFSDESMSSVYESWSLLKLKEIIVSSVKLPF
jgi:hypothetical protein